MFNFNANDPPTPEEIQAAQLRLIAAQDQWLARFGEHSVPPPAEQPQLLESWALTRYHDSLVRAAAQAIEGGLGASPYSLQRLKNAIFLNEASNAWMRGEITEAELDAIAEAMTDPAEVAALKQLPTDEERNDDEAT